MKKFLLILAAIGVGFFALGIISSLLGIRPPSGFPQPPQIPHFLNLQQDYFADVASLSSCGNSKEFFSVSPLKLTDFHGIVPLGTLAPTAHVVPTSHVYFHVRRSDPKNFNSVPAEVDVFAPTDITITEIRFTTTKERSDFDDGSIIFAPCKEVKTYYDHLKTFSPELKKAFDEGQIIRCDEYDRSYKAWGKLHFKLCNKKINLKISAGQKVGTAGGSEGQMVFDFGVYDKRVTPGKLANIKSWVNREHIVYNVCPFDYYQGDLQSQLKARLGSPEGQQKRTIEPICGTALQDIVGSAQGVWILKGEKGVGHENPHLALAHDNTDPRIAVISMGNSAENKGFQYGTYNFNPKNSGFINRDFGDIKDDQVYCFETEDTYRKGIQAVILIQMPTSTSLKIEKTNLQSCGSGGWKLTNFVEFER